MNDAKLFEEIYNFYKANGFKPKVLLTKDGFQLVTNTKVKYIGSAFGCRFYESD